MSTAQQREQALRLCRGGETVPDAARRAGVAVSSVRRWCKVEGVTPRMGRAGRPQKVKGAPCARGVCDETVPESEAWYGAQDRHCSWECYFDDIYDQAVRDAPVLGMTPGALYLRRSAPQGADA